MRSHDHTVYGSRIFISAVTAEFKSYRAFLREKLQGPSVDIKIQEDFVAAGVRTLEKLDEYIRSCNAVIHLAGREAGAIPHPGDVSQICQKYPSLSSAGGPLAHVEETEKQRISYTEWEAYLAAFHERKLFIAKPAGDLSASQEMHLARLKDAGRYPEITFNSHEDLVIQVLQSNFREILLEHALRHERRARFGPHAVESLKNILLNESTALCNEHFIYNAYVQLTGSTFVVQTVHEVDPVFRTTGPGFLDSVQREARREVLKAFQGV